MKKIIILIFSLFLWGCGESPVLETIDGKQHKLSELNGRYLVVNYWASWCKPCYEEIPELNRFYEQNQDKVLLLGVSYDRVEPEELPAIIEHMKIAFPTIQGDPAQLLGIKEIRGLPATFIFSPKGKLVKTLYGPQTEDDLLVATGLSGESKAG